MFVVNWLYYIVSYLKNMHIYKVDYSYEYSVVGVATGYG